MEHGTPSTVIDVQGVTRRLILNTGSKVSILQPGIPSCELKLAPVRPYGVTGEIQHKGRAVRFLCIHWTRIQPYVFGVLASDRSSRFNWHWFHERKWRHDRFWVQQVDTCRRQQIAPSIQCFSYWEYGTLSLPRVKGDTALNPAKGRHGVKTDSSQPAPITKRHLSRQRFGSLWLRKM